MHIECRRYHEATKLTAERLRSSPTALHWDQFPSPYREYEPVPLVDLMADPAAPQMAAWDVLRGHPGSLGSAIDVVWLSQVLYYAASLSAVKRSGSGVRYGLRVNPSSGNLHPSEIHLATRGVAGFEDGLYHYRPRTHMLERRGSGDFGFPGKVSFILSTVPWREVWKYGDRAYRYCCLDMGHLAEALRQSTRALGYEVSILPADRSLSTRIDLPEDEWPLLLLTIDQSPPGMPFHLSGGECPLNPLPSDVISAVHRASHGSVRPFAAGGPMVGGRGFGETVRSRRSALDFAGGEMSVGQLSALLTLLSGETYLFIHRVTGLSAGLYRYGKERDLEVLRLGDQRVVAAGLSLQQDLAGNACVLVAMFSDFSDGYRAAYFEAGATGQRLYIGAEALGLQATGIGAFYDDMVRSYCGNPDAEPVYHFAVGVAITDERLEG